MCLELVPELIDLFPELGHIGRIGFLHRPRLDPGRQNSMEVGLDLGVGLLLGLCRGDATQSGHRDPHQTHQNGCRDRFHSISHDVPPVGRVDSTD